MKVGIIGAGRAGCAFAFALAEKGAEITGVYSRNPESAGYIAERLKTAFENDIEKLVESAEVILLTVPDTAVNELAIAISRLCSPSCIKGKTFMHASGALTSKELEPLEVSGAHTGSLHPIQTFADRENGWKGMFGIYFGFEGGSGALGQARQLVELPEGHMLEIRPEAKVLYHAAACILSNYTVTLSYAAGMLLEAAGVGRDAGLKAFMPLLRNTVENIATGGSIKALTGPVARGDFLTVARHLSAMGDNDIAELYKAAGRMTVKLAEEKGSIGETAAEQLLEVLE